MEQTLIKGICTAPRGAPPSRTPQASLAWVSAMAHFLLRYAPAQPLALSGLRFAPLEVGPILVQ